MTGHDVSTERRDYHGRWSKSGDGFVQMPDGTRRWGLYGGAGILLRTTDAKGVTRYFLQKRSAGVQLGGTWSTPGGARNADETAVDAGLREMAEETGLIPGSGTVVHQYVHTEPGSSWTYTTSVIDIPDVRSLQHVETTHGHEQANQGWFTAAEMAELPLHPAMRQSLPELGLEDVEAWVPEPLGKLSERKFEAQAGIRGSARPHTDAYIKHQIDLAKVMLPPQTAKSWLFPGLADSDLGQEDLAMFEGYVRKAGNLLRSEAAHRIDPGILAEVDECDRMVASATAMLTATSTARTKTRIEIMSNHQFSDGSVFLNSENVGVDDDGHTHYMQLTVETSDLIDGKRVRHYVRPTSNMWANSGFPNGEPTADELDASDMPDVTKRMMRTFQEADKAVNDDPKMRELDNRREHILDSNLHVQMSRNRARERYQVAFRTNLQRLVEVARGQEQTDEDTDGQGFGVHAFKEIHSPLNPSGPPIREEPLQEHEIWDAKRQVGAALAMYPPDLRANILDVSTGIEVFPDVERGSWNRGNGHLLLSVCGGHYAEDGALVPTAVHELGHVLQTVQPIVSELEWAFLDRRTRGQEIEHLDKYGGYGENEVCVPDKFADPYVGKLYNPQQRSKSGHSGYHDSYEVFTVGIQDLYTGTITHRDGKPDPEHMDLVAGILAVVPSVS